MNEIFHMSGFNRMELLLIPRKFNECHMRKPYRIMRGTEIVKAGIQVE